MTDDQRIKLAEFVGWTYDEKWQRWILQVSDKQRDISPADQLPDPRNDANDCEALIRKLNEIGWTVEIELEPSVDACVCMFKYTDTLEIEHSMGYDGDDWKAGVCDLAERIIDD